MGFHDGFDLPNNAVVEARQRPTASANPVPPNLPLEIEWLLRSVEDDLTMLEEMPDLPRRRDTLVRKAARTLDWPSIVAERAADVTREILQEYFLLVCRSRTA